jgi:hypothetical protein
VWQCEASNLYLPPEQHAKLRALAGVTNVTVTLGQIGGSQKGGMSTLFF